MVEVGDVVPVTPVGEIDRDEHGVGIRCRAWRVSEPGDKLQLPARVNAVMSVDGGVAIGEVVVPPKQRKPGSKSALRKVSKVVPEYRRAHIALILESPEVIDWCATENIAHVDCKLAIKLDVLDAALARLAGKSAPAVEAPVALPEDGAGDIQAPDGSAEG